MQVDQPARMHELVRQLVIDPTGVCVIIGAGVSTREPSLLPSGIELARAAVASVDSGLEQRLEYLASIKDRLTSPFDLYPSYSLPFPRPEIVLEALQAVSEQNVAEALLFMQQAQPNRSHEVLAALAKRGAHLFTTNFDTLIERCEPSINVGHLHGSVGDLSELRATIQAVTRPLADDLRRSFLDTTARCQLLVVIGYSGGDTFDITPVLEEAAKGRGLRLIWVQHWQRNLERRVDRGARKVTTQWAAEEVELILCDSNWFFDSLGDALSGFPKGSSVQHRVEKGWWRDLFAQRVRQLLPAERGVAALAILEQLHSSRFFRYYATRIDEKALTPRQRLVLQRARARRECARGQYRTCKAVARRAAWWTLGECVLNRFHRRRGGIYLADVVEQLLTYAMHIRVAGQHSLVEYCRSLVPLQLASMACRFAGEPSSNWHERKRFHIGTDWAQFYSIIHNSWLRGRGVRLRSRLLEMRSWEAEQRARLLVTDPTMRGSATAIDLNYDIESFGGLVNEARASLRRALSSDDPPYRMEAKMRAVHSCYRILGDIPGYFKTELLWAEFLSVIAPDAAKYHLRKATWLLRRIRWPVLTRRYWQEEVVRRARLLG